MESYGIRIIPRGLRRHVRAGLVPARPPAGRQTKEGTSPSRTTGLYPDFVSRRHDPGARLLPPAGNIAARFVALSLLWWALTEGDTYNLWVGLVVIVAATAASVALQPVTGFRPWYLAPVFVFFVRESISGGIDVARRAFAPAMPIDPGFTEVALRLPDGPARVFLANLLNITPGTVSVELLPESLRIHMLDVEMPIEEKIREMEELMAKLFNLPLADRP